VLIQKKLIRFTINPKIMDLSDFEGLFFLKMIVPAIYLVSWTTLLFGQTLFPTFYYWYTSTISVYLLYKVF
jgi:hypothetical protein